MPADPKPLDAHVAEAVASASELDAPSSPSARRRCASPRRRGWRRGRWRPGSTQAGREAGLAMELPTAAQLSLRPPAPRARRPGTAAPAVLVRP